MRRSGRYLKNKVTGKKIYLATGVDALAVRDRLPDRNNWEYWIVEREFVDLSKPRMDHLIEDTNRLKENWAKLQPDYPDTTVKKLRL